MSNAKAVMLNLIQYIFPLPEILGQKAGEAHQVQDDVWIRQWVASHEFIEDSYLVQITTPLNLAWY